MSLYENTKTLSFPRIKNNNSDKYYNRTLKKGQILTIRIEMEIRCYLFKKKFIGIHPFMLKSQA